jgi:MFS transporter, FHS family, glucose/mannose:H+ symporter
MKTYLLPIDLRSALKNNNLVNYLLEFPNFLSLFLLSFFMMLASPILLDISRHFHVTPESINLVITFFMLGEVLGIIALIFLNKKFQRTKIIIVSYALLIPSLAGLSLAPSLILFYILYFISGFFLGIIFINANTSMLEGRVANKDSVVNLGHGFFAIGALLAPMLGSTLISRQVSWRFVYLLAMGVALISLIAYLFAHRKKKAAPLEKKEILPLKEIFKYKEKNIYMVFTVVLMLFYVMSEVTIFSWAPTFFRIAKSFDIYNAGLIISVFWVGILVGRLIISFLSYKIKAGTLLVLLSMISIIGLVVAIFPMSRPINFIGAALIGLGFSGIPPLLISTAGKIFGSGKEFSLTILFVVGIASGSVIPFFIRLIADFNFLFSIAMSIIFMVIFAIFIFIRKNYRKNIKVK